MHIKQCASTLQDVKWAWNLDHHAYNSSLLHRCSIQTTTISTYGESEEVMPNIISMVNPKHKD